jgi:hypothetical protein
MASLFSKIGGALFGKGAKQISTLSPGQQQLMQLLQGGLGGQGPLGGAFGGYDPEEINRLFQTGVGDPTRKQFQERVVPGMEQRAIASGLNRSSGLQRQMLEGELDLEGMLGGQLAQAQFGAREGELNRQLQGLGVGLGGQQTGFKPGQEGLLQGALGGFAGSFGQGLGLRNPFGRSNQPQQQNFPLGFTR